MKPKLFIDVDLENSFEGTSSSFWGDIYWRFDDDYYFPAEGWYDYVFDITGYWTNPLIELISNNGETQEFLFMDNVIMDGEYGLRVDKQNSLLNIDCCRYEYGKRFFPLASFTVELRDFVRPIYLAATRLISTYKELEPQMKKEARNKKNDEQTRRKAERFFRYESGLYRLEKFCEVIKKWQASLPPRY